MSVIGKVQRAIEQTAKAQVNEYGKYADLIEFLEADFNLHNDSEFDKGYDYAIRCIKAYARVMG